jgi:hypothetical protein
MTINRSSVDELSPRSAAGTRLLLGLAAALTSSCLDVTPLVVEEDDAALVETAVDGPTTCLACAERAADDQGCGHVLAACRREQRCAATLECTIERRCLEAADRQVQVACALPCTKTSGLASPTDPAFQAAIAIDDCLTDRCAAACPAYQR